jgi:nitrile hydratase accessory protein
MFTTFEEFAANQMLGQPDSPPRSSGKLYFSEDWQRSVFGMAVALSKAGHFEWEAFRQRLIESIAAWERDACGGETTWDYYDRYALALIAVLEEYGVIEAGELDQLAALPG